MLKKLLEKISGWTRHDCGMIPEYISNQDLTPEMIPEVSSAWNEIALFSLSFNCYQKAGAFNKCTEVGYSRDCRTLSEMRAFLYYEQRRWVQAGKHPDRETMVFIQDLLDRIREMVVKKRESLMDLSKE